MGDWQPGTSLYGYSHTLLILREEEKQRAEEQQAARKREALDLLNDPVLKRVKERNQSVGKYTKAPDGRPFAVCFDLFGPSVAHSTVKFQLDTLFGQLNDSDIKVSFALRFVC